MKFYSRRWVKHEDLNPNGTLFGGNLLKWIDEEAVIFASCQLKSNKIVTKLISEINFTNPARLNDFIEIGMDIVSFGKTSITLKCEVRDKNTHTNVLTIDRIILVNVDENGKPSPHNKTEPSQNFVD